MEVNHGGNGFLDDETDEELQEYSQLCCHIVRDVYGSFLAEIFETLTQRGRLSAPQLAQKCRLPLRQAKSALSALIQVRIVYHHTSPEGLSTYQANTTAAYQLLRSGRLVQLARDNEGQAAGEVLKELTVLGYATVQELRTHVCGPGDEEVEQKEGRRDLPNDISATGQITFSSFRIALQRLIDNGYVGRVRDAHLSSYFDAKEDIERRMNPGGAGTSAKTKKAQIELDARVVKELEQKLNDFVSADAVLGELSFLAGTDSWEAATDHILLCASYSNLICIIRNQALVRAAGKLFGRDTAQVLGAVAKQIDVNPYRIFSTSPDDLAETPQALDLDQIQVDLRTSSDHPRHRQINDANHRSFNGVMNGSNGFHGGGIEDRADLVRHLNILAEGPFSFIEYNAAADAWVVQKRNMGRFLRDKELIRLAAEGLRPDDPKLRIIRMLSDKGKLDEKNLQEVGLMNAKELRHCLSSLKVAGLLELQEVPREPQRQPNRTIFLWFYDPDRVQRLYLSRLYKSMSRLFQRLQIERDRLATTLTKVRRTDVQGSEEDMLSPAEMQVLNQLRRKEAWFMAEINRIDESITVLRDLQWT